MVSPLKSMVIAGTHSGCGKTTISLGIIAALKKRRLSIQPFKVGPDFIDPGYHEAVCGVPSRNLDGWMLERKYTLETFFSHSQGKDIAVVEGVMGLYDGYQGTSEKGSTAQIAKWLHAPVVLVIDARSMARSAGALVYGFERYDSRVSIAAVILNRVGSFQHYQWLKEAIEEKCRAKVIGYFPRDASLEIPERHLGLVTCRDTVVTKDFIEKITAFTERFIDLKTLLSLDAPCTPKDCSVVTHPKSIRDHHLPPVRIGVARDHAFCFYYQDNFDLLERWGAELIYFSPLHDASLPEGLQGIYLGGGYPELYAHELSSNRVMKKQIKEFAERGGTIYAECGGLLYLSQSIHDFDNRAHEMVGIFPFSARMEKKITNLSYYTVKSLKNTIISRRGAIMRGHQFRYSLVEAIPASLKRVYQIRKGTHGKIEREGFAMGNVLASYVHLHFGSNMNCARHFVASCRNNQT